MRAQRAMPDKVRAARTIGYICSGRCVPGTPRAIRDSRPLQRLSTRRALRVPRYSTIRGNSVTATTTLRDDRILNGDPSATSLALFAASVFVHIQFCRPLGVAVVLGRPPVERVDFRSAPRFCAAVKA